MAGTSGRGSDLPTTGIGGWVLERCLRVELDVEAALADQVGEADTGATCFRCHPAVGGNEVFRFEVQSLRGELDECLARGCCRLPDLHASALDAVRASSASLVGCQCSVAFDILNLVEANAELLGGNLRNGDPQPLAKIDLAAEHRHRAVAVDGEERIDLLRVEHTRRAAGDLRGQSTWQAGQGKTDSQGAALEKRAARDESTFRGRVHVSLPVPTLPVPRG